MIKIALILVLSLMALSLVAFGGGKTVIPELHHQAVTSRGWMSDNQFVDCYAIAQAAPGPGMLIVTMIGYKAGLPFGIGIAVIFALLATAAMFAPPYFLTYEASRFFQRYQQMPWHETAKNATTALTLGLLFASALIVARGSDQALSGWIVTAITAALVSCTKINPLILMGIAGLLGALGLVR